MSLLESCLAVAIVLIITIVAIPSLIKNSDAYVLDAAARQVAGKMHAARIKAISQNRDCRLRVTSRESYAIECEQGSWLAMEQVLTPQGIEIIANALPEFHRRGNVSPMASVILTNRHGGRKEVIVNNAGRIRVK